MSSYITIVSMVDMVDTLLDKTIRHQLKNKLG